MMEGYGAGPKVKTSPEAKIAKLQNQLAAVKEENENQRVSIQQLSMLLAASQEEAENWKHRYKKGESILQNLCSHLQEIRYKLEVPLGVELLDWVETLMKTVKGGK